MIKKNSDLEVLLCPEEMELVHEARVQEQVGEWAAEPEIHRAAWELVVERAEYGLGQAPGGTVFVLTVERKFPTSREIPVAN